MERLDVGLKCQKLLVKAYECLHILIIIENLHTITTTGTKHINLPLKLDRPYQNHHSQDIN